MSNKIQLIPIVIILLSILIIVIIQDENNQRFEGDFSYNLKKWYEKGEYLLYKNEHKIFYVYEKLSQKNKNTKLPTLLFLHGFPSSSYDYYKIWNQLLDTNNNIQNDIITFDYLGYGFSDKPENYEYSFFDMADMVDRLVLHLNIQSVVIVAHDVGDTVAQELIRRDNLKNQNNFKIERCILLNGGIINSVYQPVLSQTLMRTNYLNQIVSSNFFFRFLFFKHSFSPLFGQFNHPNNTELFDFYLNIRFNNGNRILPATINYLSEREQFGNIWLDALNETTLPVLFIYGPADPVNPRANFPQRLRIDLPRVKLSILSEMVGHYPQFEDYFTVFQLILKFLKY